MRSRMAPLSFQRFAPMNRIFHIMTYLVLAAISASAQPTARFSTLRHELGTLLWHVPGKATFEVTNTGKTDLIIKDVRPDCGCTVADWTRTPIAPGQKGIVSATFDAELLGHFEKQVAVRTNAAETPVYLTLSGNVARERKENSGDFPYHVGDVYLDSDNIEFDDVYRGDKPVKTLQVFNAGRTSFTPQLMHLPKYLSATADPEVIRPGRVGRIHITLDSEKLRGLGLTQTNIYMSRYPGDRVNKENEIYVSATLLPEQNSDDVHTARPPVAHLDSTTIDMGEMGDKSKLKCELTLTNTGKSPLVIRALQVYNPGIGVSIGKRSLKPGQSDKIKITLNANSDYFKGRRRVLLITNDPEQPKIVIDLIVKK